MSPAASDFRRLERANRRRTAFLLGIFALLLAALGLSLDCLVGNVRFEDGTILGFPLLTVVALVIAMVQALVAYYGGAGLVLAAAHARPLSADSPKHRMALDVAREISIAARVPTPPLYLADDPAPNAFAVGRDPNHAAICVTQGLLDGMDREQLQGVIGHEMAHIRDYDVRTMTIVAVTVGAIALLVDFLNRWIWFGGLSSNERKNEERGGGGGGLAALAVVILGLLAPLVSQLIAMAVSREREYLADAASVEFTRNPRGLLRALEQIAATRSPLVHASRATVHMFIVNPVAETDASDDSEGMFSALFSSHPPLARRIARLRAMLDKGEQATVNSPSGEVESDTSPLRP
jgi:heat shock protein HtpX